jgi:hypothetical protein
MTWIRRGAKSKTENTERRERERGKESRRDKPRETKTDAETERLTRKRWMPRGSFAYQSITGTLSSNGPPDLVNRGARTIRCWTGEELQVRCNCPGEQNVRVLKAGRIS